MELFEVWHNFPQFSFGCFLSLLRRDTNNGQDVPLCRTSFGVFLAVGVEWWTEEAIHLVRWHWDPLHEAAVRGRCVN